jgi:hypothetical protein
MDNFIQAVFVDRDGTIGGNDTVVYPGEFQLYIHLCQKLSSI